MKELIIKEEKPSKRIRKICQVKIQNIFQKMSKNVNKNI